MYRIAVASMIVLVTLGGLAYAQPQIATFQETAQVIIDKTVSGNITASVTIQSTSNQEIKVPGQLAKTILDNPRIVSVILTNQEGCGVLGVQEQGCILVNIIRAPEDTNIILIQETAKKFGNMVIGQLNELFDTDAVYHSSYLHHLDKFNTILDTSGVVSGNEAVSAIYTMPKEETQSMYQKISSLTIAREIRDSGGFYDTARALSWHDNASMAFSIIPIRDSLLYQLRVFTDYAGARDIHSISPLDYLQVQEIHRSKYFADGFYPLNSIFHLVMLSPKQTVLYETVSNIIPISMVDGEAIPTSLEHDGWVFDNTNGTKIDGKYLFGKKTFVRGDDLRVAFGDTDRTPVKPVDSTEPVGSAESIAIIAIIVIFAIAAAGFYLKGYRRP